MVASRLREWSDPAAVAAVVALRVLANGGLVAVTAGAVGARTLPTALAVALAALSAAVVVLALAVGVLGRRASYAEGLAQVGLVVVAGYAVSTTPSAALWGAFGVVALGAVALLLATVPLYGEAFVAP